MLKVNELKDRLNCTDDKGNTLRFDGKNLRVVSNDTIRDIGWIEMTDKGLTYRKREREADRYRKTDAWSIPTIILEEVSWIQYQSDARAYEIDANIAKLYCKTTKAKSNLEEKAYIPVSMWTIFKSMDTKEQSRIDMFGVQWYNKLHSFIWSDTMTELSAFLGERMKVNKVYPEPKNLFKAFASTPLSEVKVVFIGNEPILEDTCNGLAFHVGLPFYNSNEVKHIQDELEREGDDYMIDFNPKHVFDSSSWANQGCLMLNQCLSVEKDHQMTHEGRGWEDLIANVIGELNKLERPICFVLMGTRTYEFERYISNNYHTVIKANASAPSFVGSNIFWEIDGFLNNFYNTKMKW
jgi:uracil-DNA glycosylase